MPGTPNSVQPVPQSRAEILPFTALRGLAAWWVAIYHFYTVSLPTNGFERVILNGPLAVDLFFIMSGFVLALSYGSTFKTRLSRRSYARFMTLRLGRIYPLHIVVLVFFLSVPISLAITGRAPLEKQFQLVPYLENIVLVQNWLPEAPLDWNVPAWSISTEFLFYLVFPFFVFAVAHLKRLGSVFVTIGALLLGIAFAFGALSYTANFGPLRCLPECLLGMLLFRLTETIRLPDYSSPILFAAFLFLCAVNAFHVASDQATMPLGFSLLLWSVLNQRFWLSGLLSHPLLLWLGRISFSTYLIHFLVKYWVKFLLVGKIEDQAVLVLYLLIVALASWMLHHLIELPGREAGRTLADHLFRPTSKIVSINLPTAVRLPSSPTETGL